MGFKNIVTLVCLLFILSGFTLAQQPAVKKDSSTLYRNIESYSKGSKFKTLIYRLVFKPVASESKKKENKNKRSVKPVQQPYKTFEGKTIRNIDIVTLDPFGYSVSDTTVREQRFFPKAGNNLHIKTQGITIRNLMLIHKNDPFNSLLVKESERLIRLQKYVHEVSFYVKAAAERSDSVDIFIRELDKWSIIPKGSFSSSSTRIDLTDNNFMGTGHEFQNVFLSNSTTGFNSFNTNYYIPNIRNSYISARLHYGLDNYGYFNRGLVIDRPFFSPLAKWAAGISLVSQYKKDSLNYINPSYIPLNLKFTTQDLWVGKAQQIFKGNTEDELMSNLILAARYQRIRYTEKPSEIGDSLHVYSSEDFILGEIGVSSRKYVQDKYIFKFGVVEDVPIGIVYGITGGYQIKPDSRRLYLGLRFSFGNYYEWGYMSSNFEYGTFLNKSNNEQGGITAGINYFSGLFELGKWKFRQFVKPQVTIGINRFPYDSLTLKEGNGLSGFNSIALSGSSRLLFTLQTQSYAPWNLIGFRFGPFVNLSMGMLADRETGFRTSKVYSQVGFGVLIKNENLVINTFQISISFFPLIPGIGQNIFKMNSYRTTDFGFRDFEIGKPAIVTYR